MRDWLFIREQEKYHEIECIFEHSEPSFLVFNIDFPSRFWIWIKLGRLHQCAAAWLE